MNKGQTPVTGVVEVVHSSCWYVPSRIHELDTDVLIDSGSTYNIVDINLFKEITKSADVVLNDSQVTLRSANGEFLKVHGECVLDIEIENHHFAVNVKVVSLGDMDAILGLDFIENFDCTLRLKQGLMTIESIDMDVPLRRYSDGKCARIQAAATIEVIPETEMIVPGHVNWKAWSSQNEMGSIEPSKRITPRTGLMVAKSVVNTNAKGTVPIRIANFTDKVIRLEKGETLAILDPVQVQTLPESTSNDNSETTIDDQTVPEHLSEMVEKARISLSEAEFRMFKAKILEYQDVFKSPDGKLGRTHLTEHRIETTERRPIKQSMRRIPIHQQEAVDKEIDKMLDEGIIEESDSPWSSPLVIVKKKCGALRICSDMRVLNDLTIKDAYPIPNTSECMDSLSGAQWYCSLDLCQGYFQIPIREEDKCKTAFTTRKGHFHYNVMTMGLTNAGGTFQRLMESVLKGLTWKILVLYLDDIICYGSTFQETLDNLETVFKRLREANLKLKPSKCNLFQKEVEFLGHIISENGIRCCPKKLEAVKEWPTPKSRKEMKSFLGFAGYYRRFIKSYSEIAHPLNDLTKEKVKYIWTEKCETAFQKLKEALISSDVLAYPEKDAEYILDTDASNFGIGAVLSQVQSGKERVISYASKTLSQSQQNYCTTMRELLAVVSFVKHYHHYLYGKKFTIRCDHAPLKWIMKFKNPQDMLARWIITLGKYNFEIVHRSGVKHQNADGLSRIRKRRCKREDCEACSSGAVDSCLCVMTDCVCVITRSQAKYLETSDLPELGTEYSDDFSDGQGSREVCDSPSRALEEDRESGATAEEALESREDRVFSDGHAESSPKPKEIENTSCEVELLSVESEDSTDEFRRFIRDAYNTEMQSKEGSNERPHEQNIDKSEEIIGQSNWMNSWSRDELRTFQEEDETVRTIVSLLLENKPKPEVKGFSKDMRAYLAQYSVLEVHEGILYRRLLADGDTANDSLQYIVPHAHRQEIMQHLHNHKTSAHLGVKKTLEKIRARFYWPRYKADVVRWCAECKICVSHKQSYNPKRAPLQQSFTFQPLERIAIDIVGPIYPVTERGNLYILTVTDYFTRFVEAYAIPDQTAQTVADKLVTEWICRYGVPEVIHSDQGRNFISDLFTKMCDLLEIKKTTTSRYRPQSNGLCENMNRTLKTMLRSLTADNSDDWDDHLPFALMAYRATIQESTNVSPNMLMFGREFKLPVDLLYQTKNDTNSPTCPVKYVEWLRENMNEMYKLAYDNTQRHAERQKRIYDNRTLSRNFEVGQWVWIYYPPLNREKLGRGWVGPYLVVSKLGEVNYRVQKSETQKLITVHVDSMKKYKNEVPNCWIPLRNSVCTQTE